MPTHDTHHTIITYDVNTIKLILFSRVDISRFCGFCFIFKTSKFIANSLNLHGGLKYMHVYQPPNIARATSSAIQYKLWICYPN